MREMRFASAMVMQSASTPSAARRNALRCPPESIPGSAASGFSRRRVAMVPEGGVGEAGERVRSTASATPSTAGASQPQTAGRITRSAAAPAKNPVSKALGIPGPSSLKLFALLIGGPPFGLDC